MTDAKDDTKRRADAMSRLNAEYGRLHKRRTETERRAAAMSRLNAEYGRLHKRRTETERRAAAMSKLNAKYRKLNRLAMRLSRRVTADGEHTVDGLTASGRLVQARLFLQPSGHIARRLRNGTSRRCSLACLQKLASYEARLDKRMRLSRRLQEMERRVSVLESNSPSGKKKKRKKHKEESKVRTVRQKLARIVGSKGGDKVERAADVIIEYIDDLTEQEVLTLFAELKDTLPGLQTRVDVVLSANARVMFKESKKEKQERRLEDLKDRLAKHLTADEIETMRRMKWKKKETTVARPAPSSSSSSSTPRFQVTRGGNAAGQSIKEAVMKDADLRVLSVKQPWAWAIVNGYKTIENRNSRFPSTLRPLPKWVVIHASKGSYTKQVQARELRSLRRELDKSGHKNVRIPAAFRRGVIVGMAQIVRAEEDPTDPNNVWWHKDDYAYEIGSSARLSGAGIALKGQLGFAKMRAGTRAALRGARFPSRRVQLTRIERRVRSLNYVLTAGASYPGPRGDPPRARLRPDKETVGALPAQHLTLAPGVTSSDAALERRPVQSSRAQAEVAPVVVVLAPRARRGKPPAVAARLGRCDVEHVEPVLHRVVLASLPLPS